MVDALYINWASESSFFCDFGNCVVDTAQVIKLAKSVPGVASVERVRKAQWFTLEIKLDKDFQRKSAAINVMLSALLKHWKIRNVRYVSPAEIYRGQDVTVSRDVWLGAWD